MQVNQIQPQAHQQTFCAFNFHAGVKEAFQQRASKLDIEEICKLVAAQKLNKNVDITLYTNGYSSNKLGANIYPTDCKTSISTQYSQEGIFYKFTSPLKFIKKICKKADKMSADIELEKTKNEALKQFI